MKRDDSLWKAILEDVFDDFLRFFFDNAEELFDFGKPFEFLDKELEQLFPINPDDFSPKYVDKLIKVFTKTGDEKWILVHIEVQANTDNLFAHRMFQYFYRIYDRYQRPITAFAILTDKNKRFKPLYFEESYLGTKLRYDFNTYKVLEQNPEVLTNSNNPFAMVVLTVLVALQKGKVTESELLNQKIDLLKRLISKGYSRQKIEALMSFLKLYVRFGKNENDAKFDNAIEQLLNKPKETMGIVEFVLERERRLGEKKGIKKGIEKGIEKERYERNFTFVSRLLKETGFDDAKIAELAGVTLEFVQSVRQQNA
ncbi:Rpn family recombination-promoting nuclease/putative transposase [Runella limosa]|uniref:Rpn family recombination-promoting nuclease/putative transposase n=1 Tax=Runella limosa TaxID=370978 RepID=UPI0004052057|nr:Rpn family recombination-promoting nuclease/putative transposase [Runella limosa]